MIVAKLPVTSQSITITAAFAGTNVTGNAMLVVDVFDALQLSADAYPACAATECSGKTTIRRIQTLEGPFQRLKLKLTAVSKELTQKIIDVDSDVVVTLSSTDTLISASETVGDHCRSEGASECEISDGSLETAAITGVGAGDATVAVDWFGAQTHISISVVEAATVVVDVTVTSPTSTVRTVSGASTAMVVSADFDDGTTLGDLKGITFVSYSDYLVFDTSRASTLDVDAEGVLTALLNTAGSFTVTISAFSSLDSGLLDSVDLTVNLVPSLYDVDLGKKSSSQFPRKAVGDKFTVSAWSKSIGLAITLKQACFFIKPTTFGVLCAMTLGRCCREFRRFLFDRLPTCCIF